jgi:hypothetical protein
LFVPLNDAGLVVLANALRQTLLFAQLHSDVAGTGGDNIAIAGRLPVTWATPDSDGDFGLASAVVFTGGTPGAPVYSVTLWDDETAGAFYGEFALGGDSAFSTAGQYSVTAIDFVGTSS